MSPKPYQFSILRYRESKSSGEFVNIGLVMTVPDDEMVLHFVTQKYSRLSSFFWEFDPKAYKSMRDDLERHFLETLLPEENGGTQLDLGEFVRSQEVRTDSLDDLQRVLIPEKESCFQWSTVMSGIHPAPEKRFQELKWEFLERNEESRTRERTDERSIRSTINQILKDAELADRVHPQVLRGNHNISHDFPIAWKNGRTQVLDAVSFDLLQREQIKTKALHWFGMLTNFAEAERDFEFTAVVAPPPRKELFKSFDDACTMLGDMEQTRDVIREDEVERVVEEIAGDLG